ncbi:hypothetical protein ACFXO2_24670, partial [Streptomyces sp. NPDC059152]|uniref:hypothetical protein n=1 Tax=Streptomyces sp. NPDC059152 TaxID=3346742 RepID=UPI0036923460
CIIIVVRGPVCPPPDRLSRDASALEVNLDGATLDRLGSDIHLLHHALLSVGEPVRLDAQQTRSARTAASVG